MVFTMICYKKLFNSPQLIQGRQPHAVDKQDCLAGRLLTPPLTPPLPGEGKCDR